MPVLYQWLTTAVHQVLKADRRGGGGGWPPCVQSSIGVVDAVLIQLWVMFVAVAAVVLIACLVTYIFVHGRLRHVWGVL
jgi:hypothetical protein